MTTHQDRIRAMEREIHDKVDKHRDDFSGKYSNLDSRVGALEAHMEHVRENQKAGLGFLLALLTGLVLLAARVFLGIKGG